MWKVIFLIVSSSMCAFTCSTIHTHTVWGERTKKFININLALGERNFFRSFFLQSSLLCASLHPFNITLIDLWRLFVGSRKLYYFQTFFILYFSFHSTIVFFSLLLLFLNRTFLSCCYYYCCHKCSMAYKFGSEICLKWLSSFVLKLDFLMKKKCSLVV